ncbi:TIGR04211 family SH3 domain-containing protein [Salinibius halmophilus]|uniref:TIGR04211 family SH3 domain-containing protein n=1 Tax=Salinibius halmophilus TaxID=1853216 RepID=UPI000E6696FB|nr:TIGR04211 family SH3 domain-containing protein [Salinibius halmophilus]
MKKIATLAAGLLVVASSALAQTFYIKDELTLRLREGPGTSYGVAHNGVVSGTALEATGNTDSGWREVIFEGKTAWVNDFYLQEEPIAAVRLEALQAEYEALQAQLEQALADGPLTAEQVAQLRADIENAYSERDAALARVEEVERLSENAISLNERNNDLNMRNRELEQKLQQLEAENQLLRDEDATQRWLIIGVAVVLALCVALFVVSVRPKSKRHDTWV